MPSPAPASALRAQRSFEAIGTVWRIDTEDDPGPEIWQRVDDRIERFDATWSRFRSDSIVSLASRVPGVYPLPEDESGPLYAVYRALGAVTDGAMSPFVGDSLAHLGYDSEISLVHAGGHLPAPEWGAGVDWDVHALATQVPATLDIGAAGKGFLVDIVAAQLHAEGLDSFVVDAGGDMVIRACTQRIGLEHPFDPTRAVGVVEVSSGAVCASAVNRRAWGEGLHHVIDARTGAPVDEVVATWVLADSGLLADGIATALFLTEPAGILERFEFDYVRMFSDGRVQYSEALPGEVFTR